MCRQVLQQIARQRDVFMLDGKSMLPVLHLLQPIALHDPNQMLDHIPQRIGEFIPLIFRQRSHDYIYQVSFFDGYGLLCDDVCVGWFAAGSYVMYFFHCELLWYLC